MAVAREKIKVKRVYEEPSASDGVRVLVDRIWPRGLTKKDATADYWLRDLAPSNELRKWVHSHPERRQDFRRKYFKELESPSIAEAVGELRKLLQSNKTVTLLFASKNMEYNNASVLKEFIQSRGRPAPRGTSHSRRQRA